MTQNSTLGCPKWTFQLAIRTDIYFSGSVFVLIFTGGSETLRDCFYGFYMEFSEPLFAD